MPPPRHLQLFLIVFALCNLSTATESTHPRFSFGSGPNLVGTNVGAETLFTTARGYGFESGGALITRPDGVESTGPFYFSATVPMEGNYLVTVIFPPRTDATIKAELRRLVIENVCVPIDAPAAARTFLVNTRSPKIAAVGDLQPGAVHLKAPRETTQEASAWDNVFTLEFNGAHPAVSAIAITPAPLSAPTIFFLGNSTVCDQSKEPFKSWGQM